MVLIIIACKVFQIEPTTTARVRWWSMTLIEAAYLVLLCKRRESVKRCEKKEESINVCACIFVLRAKVLHVIIETCANSAPRYSMKTFSCACSYTTEFVQLRNRKVKFVRQFLPFLCMCEFWLHNKRGSKATELHAVVRISARYMFVCTLPSQLERANNALIYAEAQTAIFCTACSRDGPCFCLFPLLWLPLVHV